MSPTEVRLRPFGAGDIDLACDIATAARPDEPMDPVVERYHWEQPSPGLVREWLIAEDDAGPAAFVVHEHPEWEGVSERNWWMSTLVSPGREALLPGILRAIEVRAREGGGTLLIAECREDEATVRTALEASGFHLDHESKVWELDLVARREALLQLTAETRVEMRRQGISLLTVEADPDPNVLPGLYAAWYECRRVMPRSHEMTPIPYETWETWMRSPDHRFDRNWIARDGDHIVATSNLVFPPTRGNVWTGFTGTVPGHQGRGIARAVKMETLAQAIELGVPRVRTDNDERNAPMLHINERLGYHRLPSWMAYEKEIAG